MTRFVADAIQHRGGRQRSTYSGSELRKNMEIYKATGRHPDIEAARQAARETRLKPLPVHDPNNPYVYLTLTQGKTALGRLVIELFHQEAPGGSTEFRNRCNKGAAGCFLNTTIDNIYLRHSIRGGLPLPSSPLPHTLVTQCRDLSHCDKGAVSLALDGRQMVIATARCQDLDDTHQVVGRVHLGMDVLAMLDELPTDELQDYAPLKRITVSDCGPTTANGDYEGLQETASGAHSLTAAEQVEKEAAGARDSVRSALHDALQSSKRKAAEGAGPPAKARKGMMVEVLSESDSDAGSSDGA